MSKVLKNNTLSNIELSEIGLTIPASGQIEVPVTDYLLLGLSDSIDEISPFINSGDIIINNGTEDLIKEKGINWIKYQDNFINSNNLYVSINGSDSLGDGSFYNPFNSINRAVEFVNTNSLNSSTNPVIISIGSGEFQEDQIILPDYTKLIGVGDSSTILIANNSSQDFIELKRESIIQALQIQNVTGLNKSAIIINNTTANNYRNIMRGIQINNCSIGIKATSSSTFSALQVDSIRMSGLSEIGLSLESNINATLVNCLANSATFTMSKVDSGCKLSIFNGRLINANIGIEVLNSGEVSLFNIDLSQISGTPIKCSSSTAIIKHIGCQFDESNIEIDDLNVYSGLVSSFEPNENRISLSEELSVGLPELGRETALGEGDSYVRGVLVYNFDGSSYSNITTDTRTESDGNIAGFPNTAVNSAVYITTTLGSGNLEFSGIKCNTSTAAIGGEIVAEYYDGSDWVEFNTCSSQSSDNYLPYAKQIFQRQQSEQIRFDKDIIGDQVKTDPMSLGTSYYWIRFRIISSLTTAPQFEQIKLHTNRSEFNSDGFMEYFGQARPVKVLPFSYNSFNGAINSPLNSDIYLDDILAVGRIENTFGFNDEDRVGLNEYLPLDIDTSCKVKLLITFATDNESPAGQFVRFNVYWAKSSDSDSVYSSSAQAPTVATGRQFLTNTTNPTSNYQQNTMQFELDVSDFIARDLENTGDMFWLTIERPNDTYDDDIFVQQIRMLYVALNDGGHV